MFSFVCTKYSLPKSPKEWIISDCSLLLLFSFIILHKIFCYLNFCIYSSKFCEELQDFVNEEEIDEKERIDCETFKELREVFNIFIKMEVN